MNIENRFWKKINKTDGCWEWLGGTDRRGYGRFYINRNGVGRTDGAHRVSWEFANGKIPDGLFVCHRCDNPSCVRPDHLFLGTYQDNITDMVKKGRNKYPVLYGEDSPRSKLTQDQVDEIRKRYIPYKVSSIDLAKEYGTSQSNIDRILKHKTWNQP